MGIIDRTTLIKAARPHAIRIPTNEVLRRGVPRVAVEAAAMGWREWADATVTIDHVGASAPGDVLFERFGFTPERVAAQAREFLR